MVRKRIKKRGKKTARKAKPQKKNHKNLIFILFVISFIFAALFLVEFRTGNVSLEFTELSEQENLQGALKLSLEQEEVIPDNAELSATLNRQHFSKSLSELVNLDENTTQVNIDLSQLNFTPEPGILKITIVSEGNTIASIEKEVSKSTTNETINSPTNETNIDTEEKTNVNITEQNTTEQELIDENIAKEDLDIVEEDIANVKERIELNKSADNLIEIIKNITIPALEPDLSQNISIDELNLTIKTKRDKIVLGKPVRWLKEIKAEQPTNLTIALGRDAENITVKKIEEGEKKNIPSLTGLVSADIELSNKEKKGILTNIYDLIKKILSSFTGFAISNTKQENTNQEIDINESASEYEVEFYTPAPVAYEQQIGKKKIVTITGPGELDYIDILTYTHIDENLKIGEENKIKVFWREENKYVASEVYDTDNNGFLDYVSWNTPHLSNQSFEISIIILTLQSYPIVAGNWSVEFETSGTANLTIKASNGTTWSNINENNDLKFLGLKCDNENVDYVWENNSVYVQNYNCDDKTSIETSKVLTSGKHTLMFHFGDDIAYAYNDASSWANSSFDRCKNITINNQVGSNLIDFPAYINLTYDSDMLANYSDLRFYNTSCNNGGTLLAHEIENYTGTNAHIWVRIPTLSTGNNTISVYYKNNTAVASGENKTGVWDSNYKGVWHLGETSGNFADSTSNGNTGTDSVSATGKTGKIGRGQEFDGTDDYISVADHSSLNVSNITIEFWVNLDTVGAADVLVTKTTDTKWNDGWGVDTYGISKKLTFWVNGDSNKARESGTFSGSAWTHVVGTYDGTTIRLYKNGSETANTSYSGAITTPSVTLELGRGKSDEYNIDGYLDEMRISGTAHSAADINMSYQIVANQASYVNFSEEENRTGGAGTTPSAKKFAWTNSSFNVVASLDDKGDLYLKGTALQSQSSLNPPINSFVIQNKSEDNIAYINDTGNMFLRGVITESSDLSGRTNTNFEFRNSSNDLVAFFDNIGNLKLKGGLSQSYASP